MTDVMGVVQTSIQGSECEFYICDSSEWDGLTEEEQDKLIVEAMWESGMVEVWAKRGETE